MTPQESQSLQQLLSQLVQVGEVVKDADAERLISQAASQQPNAVYLLVQRVMILEHALGEAQERIAALEMQQRSAQSSAQSSGSNSFLDANAWGKTPVAPATAAVSGAMPSQEVSLAGMPLRAPANRSFATQPSQAYPATGSGSSSFLRGGGGSMLGTIAATAAGIAGGAFLYQGIGNLLGNDAQHSSENVPGNRDNLGNPSTDNANNLAGIEPETASGKSEPMFDDPGGLDIPTDEQLSSDANFDTDLGADSDSDEV
ncbi:DUF2076 family protein [Noviherbaspirillum sp. Root189]|uniref:DUF2076 family protein n=1 Tax=Noviherbaspirillum sp. Root189 TaxID=1736487 RepID=UPI00070B9A68|nr:DUF2076 family protein [Noviherbaspirillum sp. Root189]KRB66276.1 hypothetical protein ASE07_10355 [Noviherbaspirillum sp. Root189]